MARIVDSMVRAMKPGKKLSEPVTPRGSLLIVRRKNGAREFYYRRRLYGHEDNIKIGVYTVDEDAAGIVMTLAKARNAAAEIAQRYHDAPDIKAAMESEKQLEALKEQVRREQEARRAALGSLCDLIMSYTERMRCDGKTSWKGVQKQLIRHVLEPFPELADKKAYQVDADDIEMILVRMIKMGITTTVNRVRGDLHAAFNYGLKHDRTPWLKEREKMSFQIQFNPVSQIPSNKNWERALNRSLNPEELRLIWEHSVPLMGIVYGTLLRVMICTGVRPTEWLRMKVGDILVNERAVFMTQTKNSIPNLVPLNRFAMEALQPLLDIGSQDDDLFPSARQNAYSDPIARASVLGNAIAELRQSIPKMANGMNVEHFTARDIRRTVKTLMGQAGIRKDVRDRLQNHAQTDVSSKHYDRYDYWAEKCQAARTWENWLDQNIVNPPSPTDRIRPAFSSSKVIDLSVRRKKRS